MQKPWRRWNYKTALCSLHSGIKYRSCPMPCRVKRRVKCWARLLLTLLLLQSSNQPNHWLESIRLIRGFVGIRPFIVLPRTTIIGLSGRFGYVSWCVEKMMQSIRQTYKTLAPKMLPRPWKTPRMLTRRRNQVAVPWPFLYKIADGTMSLPLCLACPNL